MWRSQSDALGARCVFCNFPYFHVPTWEVALVTFQSAPSGAHMWNRRSLVSSHCVQKDWSITQYKPKLLLYNCAPFKALLCVLVPILPFLARHDFKWRPCIWTLGSIDIMNQVCYEGTYLGAQHILDPANNSSWAWHTVAAMLAIWDYPKSWAHLATLPCPIPEKLGDAQKICWTHMT